MHLKQITFEKDILGNIVEITFTLVSEGVYSVQFKVNNSFDFNPYLSKKERYYISKFLYSKWNEFIKKNQYDSIFCQAHSLDGGENYRKSVYEKLGFVSSKIHQNDFTYNSNPSKRNRDMYIEVMTYKA
jgi:hypothetical protein